jgi:hypothetical protein
MPRLSRMDRNVLETDLMIEARNTLADRGYTGIRVVLVENPHNRNELVIRARAAIREELIRGTSSIEAQAQLTAVQARNPYIASNVLQMQVLSHFHVQPGSAAAQRIRQLDVERQVAQIRDERLRQNAELQATIDEIKAARTPKKPKREPTPKTRWQLLMGKDLI